MLVRVFNLIITDPCRSESVIIKRTIFTSISSLVCNYYLSSLLHDLIAESEIGRVAPPIKYQQNNPPDSSRTLMNSNRPDRGPSGVFGSEESCREEPAGTS